MSGATIKRSISNQTESRKKHQVRFITSLQGRTVSEIKTLNSGETTGLEDGDRLTIISDSDTNYAIQWKNGDLLGAEQVNNNHPKFPSMTVASYRLASVSKDGDNEIMEVSGIDRGDNDPDGGNGSGGTIIIKEPEEPIP